MAKQWCGSPNEVTPWLDDLGMLIFCIDPHATRSRLAKRPLRAARESAANVTRMDNTSDHLCALSFLLRSMPGCVDALPAPMQQYVQCRVLPAQQAHSRARLNPSGPNCRSVLSQNSDQLFSFHREAPPVALRAGGQSCSPCQATGWRRRAG